MAHGGFDGTLRDRLILNIQMTSCCKLEVTSIPYISVYFFPMQVVAVFDVCSAHKCNRCNAITRALSKRLVCSGVELLASPNDLPCFDNESSGWRSGKKLFPADFPWCREHPGLGMCCCIDKCHESR